MSTDFLDDLEQRLAALADTASPPAVASGDALDRGRRGLGRRRAAIGGVALATAAVVTVAALGITGSSDTAAPDAADTPSETATDPVPPPSPSPTPTEPPVDRRNAKQLLRAWAKALATHLDPQGGHLQVRPDNLQGGAGLGTKLGWAVPGDDGLGMVQIYVGPDAFQGGFGNSCDRFSPPCEEVTVRGVTMRVQRTDGGTAVYHTQDDGDRVLLVIDPLFGNNSLVPLDDLEFGLRTLAAAVSDPAFTSPTQQQINGAEQSMFPGLPPVSGNASPPPR